MALWLVAVCGYLPCDDHLHFLLLTCFFWEIWFYLNQISNSVQPMKTEKNTRLIQATSIWRIEIKQPCLSVSDFQALPKSMAQPDCCCTPTRAEINGIVASGCVWLSWFNMMSIPLPALHMLLLKDLVLLGPNCKLSATYENGKKHPTHTSYEYLTHRS